MNLEDVRKTVESTLETLTPAKAQQLAKGLTDPGAAKDQVAKAAAEILQWSQRNRERLQTLVRREIESQLRTIGVATRADVDALAKRVRVLERGGKKTASAANKSRAKTTSRATTTASRSGKAATAKRSASKSRAKRPAARRSPA
jgi:polyhydroxyalkanoate synthesis regulator phasin